MTGGPYFVRQCWWSLQIRQTPKVRILVINDRFGNCRPQFLNESSQRFASYGTGLSNSRFQSKCCIFRMFSDSQTADVQYYVPRSLAYTINNQMLLFPLRYLMRTDVLRSFCALALRKHHNATASKSKKRRLKVSMYKSNALHPRHLLPAPQIENPPARAMPTILQIARPASSSNEKAWRSWWVRRSHDRNLDAFAGL